jgi:hypothetical protein
MPTTQELTSAAERLHRYILDEHWQSPVISGPDPGIRWNAKLGRFAKSYAPFVNWRDDLIYAQAQKYWIHANLLIDELGLGSGSDSYQVAVECADYLHSAQTPEGYWEYPNPEWSGRIATVEGNYAAIGMLLTHERSGAEHLLTAARRWYEYTLSDIGFQLRNGTLAINYFGNRAGGRVPNNSASTVRLYAMLADATGDDRYLEHCGPMLDFMAEAQVPTGELPYSVVGVTGGAKPHFLCYQYNAFQFLNIHDYWRLTLDGRAEPILRGLSRYLEGGLTESGAARYDCSNDVPEVVYYSPAVGVALREATDAGFGDHGDLVDSAFSRLLSHQRLDGGFPYSFENYRYVRDSRSYPRYLSMILTHLLTEIAHRQRESGIAGS